MPLLSIGIIALMIFFIFKGLSIMKIDREKAEHNAQMRASYLKEQRISEIKNAAAEFQKNSNSFSNEIANLKRMKDEGILSEEEFNQAKAKILNN